MPLLRIDIAASFAQFQDAMTAIERSAKKSAGSLQSAFKGVNSTLAGLGVSISVGGLAALVKSSIDAADHINDLSKRTGVAVEVLGGIGFAAAQAGSSLDGVATVIGKLNKSIAEAGSGNLQVGEAFKKLKISVEDGSGGLKRADAVLVELAGRFEALAEGPEKAALANRIFGKSYQEILPLLEDGAASLRKNIDYYQKYSGVTQDIAERSDAFNDSLVKIGLLSRAAGNQIAAELLPTLQLLVDKMLEVKDSSDGFSAVGKAINTVVEAVTVLGVNTSYVFKQLGNEIGGIAAQLGALFRADPGGPNRSASGFSQITAIAEMMREDAKAARAEVDRTTAEILSPNKGQAAPEVMEVLNGPRLQKPIADRLSSTGADPAAARLSAELRELERLNDRERELLATRNEFLQEYYQQDLIAINDYYTARDAAAQEALNAQVANIDKEVALLRARRGKDATETTQNESKIKELIERRGDLQQKAGLDAIKRTNEQTQSTKELQRALEDVNVELLEQQGKFGEAAARRFDDRNKQLKQRLETELAAANSRPDADGVTTVRGSRGLVVLDNLRDIAIAQGKLNEIQDKGSRIQSDLAIASERAAIAAQNGSISELQSMRAVSDARAQAAVDLKAVADAYAEMAEKTGNADLVQRAKEMQVEVEKLANSADLVREKFQDVFQSGFESFFDKLMSGTASIKDALKSLVSEVATDFAKIGIRDLGQQLLGKEGALGGIVDTASKFFGGAPAAPIAAATKAIASVGEDAAGASSAAALASLATVTASADASMITLATTTISTDAAMVALTASASTAAAALAAVSATSATESAGGIIGLFDDFASFAANGNIYDSGNVIPFAKGGVPSGIVDSPTLFGMSGGRTGLMGEAGPEAIMPLHRDTAGQLAVKVIGMRGNSGLLPLARDGSGKLSVRAAEGVLEKYAVGGVFQSGVESRTAGFFGSEALSPRASVVPRFMAPVERAGGGDVYHISVEVPAGTPRESADQIAQRTAIALQRASRRNG